MKAFFIQFFLMTSLLTLVACGAKEKSIDLKVTSGFALNSALTGGIMAYGEGPAGETFSVSSSDATELSAVINDGAWKIYVVGWDGATSFVGNKQCGMVAANIGSSDSSVSITISAAACTGAFQTDIGLYDVFTTSCGAFYKYAPMTDTFSAPDSNNFCATLPSSLKYSHEYYKISGLNKTNITGARSLGISSGCIAGDPTVLNRRSLPTKKFPLLVQTYPSLQDCTNSTANVAPFAFPSGLALGDGNSFDHHFEVTSTTQVRLALPSSMTRRGRSPFMSMLPRVLCGAPGSFADCLPASYTGLSHINVPFNDGNKGGNKQLILKGVGDFTPIPVGFLSPMNYFSVYDTEVENGNIVGSVARNHFTCQDTSEFASIRDIYYKNDLVYVLSSSGTESWVKIFTLTGREIDKVTISGLFYDLVVGPDKSIYVAHSALVKKYEVITSDTYTYDWQISATGIEDMELNAAGDTLAVALDIAGSNYIKVFLASDGTTAGGTDRLYTTPMKQMQLVGNILYFLGGSGFKSASFTSSVGTVSPVTGTPANSWESFAVDGVNVYGFDVILYTASKYALSNISSIITSASTLPPYSGSSPKQMIMVEGRIFVADNNHNQLTILDPATMSIVPSNITGTCLETKMAAAGSVAENLSIVSQKDDSIYRLFEKGFEIAGLRFVVDPQLYYFFHPFQSDSSEIRTGGELNRVQSNLGPDGIASFVSEFPDCTSLLTFLNTKPGYAFTRTRTLRDMSENQTNTYTVTVAKINQAITNDYYCKDNLYTGTCNSSLDKFDIQMSFHHSDLDKSEVTKIKLQCGRKVGRMENAELEDSELRRELITWNTGDNAKSRFEIYEIDQEDGFRANVSKFEKTGPENFWSRSIHTEEKVGNISGSVTEYHRSIGDNSGSSREFIMNSFHLSDTTIANFISNSHGIVTGSFDFDDIKINTTFNSSISASAVAPAACLNLASGNVQATNEMLPTATCYNASFTSPGSSSSLSEDEINLTLKINSFIGVSSPLHPLWDVYEIPAP